MKRRGFLKFLGMAAAAPVAIVKAVEQPKRMADKNGYCLNPDGAEKLDCRICYPHDPQNQMYILTENAKPFEHITRDYFYESAKETAFRVGDFVTIGDDPTIRVIGENNHEHKSSPNARPIPRH